MKWIVRNICIAAIGLILGFIMLIPSKINAVSWGYEATKMSYFNDKLKEELKKDHEKSENEIVIVVLDSGVDPEHPWYKDRLVSEYAANCEVDINDGKCIVGNFNDYNNHGTHVTGIISAITPDNVTFLPIKVTKGDTGSVPCVNVYAALDYILELLETTDLNIKAINFSVSNVTTFIFGYEENREYSRRVNALYEKGVMFVTTAGNENKLRWSSWVQDAPQTIVVASIDENMEKSYFSNYGADVDFAAPGSVIESSIPDLYLYNLTLDDEDDSYYVIEWPMSGTSMAAPHVTADIALIYAKCPNCSVEKVNNLLLTSTVDLGVKGHDWFYGNGYINMEYVYYKLSKIKIEEKIIGPGIITKRGAYGSVNDHPMGWMIIPAHDIKTTMFGGTEKNVSYVSAGTTIGYRFKPQKLFWLLPSKLKYIKINDKKITDEKLLQEYMESGLSTQFIEEDLTIELKFSYF